jgi:Protein of unknown function (DUF3489)
MGEGASADSLRCGLLKGSRATRSTFGRHHRARNQQPQLPRRGAPKTLGSAARWPRPLAELAAAWPPERLVAIWNSLPGVTAVKRFKTSNAAASRIWERIQGLGEAAKPEANPAKPKAERKPKAGALAAKGAPAKGKATKKATPAKKTPRAKKAVKPAKEESGPREGSKTAQVVAMLQRKGGATLAEIMKATGWQAHSVRGFISGTLGKKMGRTVQSTKREDGERLYQLKG